VTTCLVASAANVKLDSEETAMNVMIETNVETAMTNVTKRPTVSTALAVTTVSARTVSLEMVKGVLMSMSVLLRLTTVIQTQHVLTPVPHTNVNVIQVTRVTDSSASYSTSAATRTTAVTTMPIVSTM
jgi:hypothetical protein